MTLKAQLGGTDLNYGATWELRTGVRPVESGFILSSSRCAEILKRGSTQIPGKDVDQTRTRREQDSKGPLTLTIGEQPIKGLYALEHQPVNDYLGRLLSADARWLLKRKHYTREFNVRKPTGTYRMVQGERTPIEVNDPIADFGYKRVTLNNGRKWTAGEVLADVLTSLVGTNWRLASGLPLSVPIHDLVLDDTGDAAISRVLAYLPGSSIYVDRNGVFVVINSLDQSEASVFKRLRSEGRKVWGDDVRLVEKHLMRPRHVGVFFESEFELRFDYTEGSRPTSQRGREPRLIENVLPVVHPSVTFNGKTYAKGSWLQVDDWITATQAQLAADGDNSDEYPLSQALFRQHMPTGFMIPRAAIATYNRETQSPYLDQIFNAVETHWRKTFRISPKYMDKLKTIKSTRVGIMDQETGTRARAEVYADYVVRPSRRGILKSLEDNTKAAYNFTSYADDVSTASPSPVNVKVIDGTQGIFTLEFVLDPGGLGARILPGRMDSDVPTWSAATRQGRDKFFAHWHAKEVKLSSTYKVAVILSATRAAPNDVSRYHLEKVDPADVSALLPGTTIGRCLGAPWSMKMGGKVETARFGWSDKQSALIDQAVWDGLPLPTTLLINPEQLRDVAKARAAQVYGLMIDRYEGTMSVSLDTTLEPTGSISSVKHSHRKDGVSLTTLTAPPVTIPIDVWSLMPDSTRKILLKEVQE